MISNIISFLSVAEYILPPIDRIPEKIENSEIGFFDFLRRFV